MIHDCMNQKEIGSFLQVDFSDIRLPGIVLYDHPKDMPDKYVARIWDFSIPDATDTYMAAERIETLHDAIKTALPGMLFMKRGEDDDPVIMGVYV